MKLLGTFPNAGSFRKASAGLRQGGFTALTQFSPTHVHEGDEVYDTRMSPVRWYTLGGALFGIVSGFALTVWTSVDQGLIVGGKPIISLPAFVVIAFELTILFGALATFLGFLIHARVPRLALDEMYGPEFSGDTYGLVVHCSPEDAERAGKLLRTAGALEIKSV